ncbi:MAG TPA: zf-HC2 domain-containing protein [Blastocatellia bacterium]|nr:zf-HC2 domain-containing protein [Blastocatellia bacterium]
MNVLEFEHGYCKRIKVYLDSYVNNELMVETTHEVLRHLDSCKECAAELEAKTRVKSLLQNAVLRDGAPAALRERIRRDIRRGAEAWWSPRNHVMQWTLAAAAALVLFVGGWSVLHSSSSRRPQPRAPEAALLRPEIPNAEILNIGLSDHINCAVVHDQQDKRLTSEEMAERLGPDYAGLVPVVKAKAAGFEMVMAHRCHVENREFVHLILRNQDRVCSLVITKKDGESFPSDDAAAIEQATTVPTYRARTRDYEVTGFETRDYLGFVVSNLSASDNRMLASSLAPAVRDFLARLEA